MKSNVDEVKTLTEQSMLSATKWFSINRLIVNSKKSDILLVGSKKNQNINGVLSVALGPIFIDRSTEIKPLGVIMDEHLNFANHVSYLVKKISPLTSLLHRL